PDTNQQSEYCSKKCQKQAVKLKLVEACKICECYPRMLEYGQRVNWCSLECKKQFLEENPNFKQMKIPSKIKKLTNKMSNINIAAKDVEDLPPPPSFEESLGAEQVSEKIREIQTLNYYPQSVPTNVPINFIVNEKSSISNMDFKNDISHASNNMNQISNNTNNIKSPVIQQKSPVIQQESPVIQQKSPVIQQESPVIQQKNPVIQQKSPIIQQESPVIQQKSPIIQQKSPIIKQQSPSVQEQSFDIPDAQPDSDAQFDEGENIIYAAPHQPVVQKPPPSPPPQYVYVNNPNPQPIYVNNAVVNPVNAYTMRPIVPQIPSGNVVYLNNNNMIGSTSTPQMQPKIVSAFPVVTPQLVNQIQPVKQNVKMVQCPIQQPPIQSIQQQQQIPTIQQSQMFATTPVVVPTYIDGKNIIQSQQIQQQMPMPMPMPQPYQQRIQQQNLSQNQPLNIPLNRPLNIPQNRPLNGSQNLPLNVPLNQPLNRPPNQLQFRPQYQQNQ
ncbi:29605_t:CDS:2, partial [Racocetra persica]